MAPFSYGTAYIVNRPVDDGAYVDVLVVRGVNDHAVCGTTTVSRTPPAGFDSRVSGPGTFVVPIEPIPD